MSDFKAKMHKTRFLLQGSAPDPAEKAYSAPIDLLAVFNEPTCKGRTAGRGRGGKGNGRGGE